MKFLGIYKHLVEFFKKNKSADIVHSRFRFYVVVYNL